jgi:NADH-quinone oxidoreductase subunit G
MPTFKLDGKTIPFESGDTIIRAAWKQGIEVPHYCWHPGLSAPANCRMCLVEIKPPEGQRGVMLDIVEWDAANNRYKNIRKPKLLPACQMSAVENQEVLAETSAHVKEARSYVQEALLLNHPVDCPICDQAGECKLQDYWLEHQAKPKRMLEEPVHKPKGVSFGDTIVYDAERCVMCTRCIRFMDEVAKDPVLEMRERGNLNEIMVAPGRKLEGNYTFMVEHVCPVGALTTKDFRFKARVWFLRSAKSVCQGCATGCNTHLDFDPRSNKVQRARPRDNEAVNKFWMCDPGMLTYRQAHEGRILAAQIGGKTATTAAAVASFASKLKAADATKIAIVFGVKHSQEDNVALRELAGALGAAAFFTAGDPAGFADDILIHADKNANRAGVAQIAPGARDFAALSREVSEGRYTHVVALGAAADSMLEAAGAALLAIVAHDGSLLRGASVVLPAAAWAEAAGTFVNAKGMAQVADKAIEPQGESKPAWQWLREVMVELGHEPAWTRLRDVRALFAPAVRVHAAAEAVATTPAE